MINDQQVQSTQTEMKSKNVFKKNWLKFALVLACLITLTVFSLIYQKSQKTQATPSPSPSAVPYYQQENFQKARDKVIFQLPYIKTGIKIEYFVGAQAIQATIETESVEDYRNKKLEAEKFLIGLGVNICDLHIGWVPKGDFKRDLIFGDVATTGC